jgi:hypothetical protein
VHCTHCPGSLGTEQLLLKHRLKEEGIEKTIQWEMQGGEEVGRCQVEVRRCQGGGGDVPGSGVPSDAPEHVPLGAAL